MIDTPFSGEGSMAKTDEQFVSDAVAEEIKKLRGTWKQIAYEKDGLTEPLDEFGWEPRVTFTGDTFVVTLADGSIAIKGIFKLDPTRELKTIDWMDLFGADAGQTFLAIYSLKATDSSSVPRTMGRSGPQNSEHGQGKSSAFTSARGRELAGR